MDMFVEGFLAARCNSTLTGDGLRCIEQVQTIVRTRRSRVADGVIDPRVGTERECVQVAGKLEMVLRQLELTQLRERNRPAVMRLGVLRIQFEGLGEGRRCRGEVAGGLRAMALVKRGIESAAGIGVQAFVRE